MVKVNERIAGPQLQPQLLARHHMSRTLEQHQQDLKRLILELDAPPLFAQLARQPIGFEGAKPKGLQGSGRVWHGESWAAGILALRAAVPRELRSREKPIQVLQAL